MPGSRTARRAVGGLLVGLLLALLAAPSAHAGPVSIPQPESFYDWLWRALARACVAWPKEGSMMDPGGLARGGPSPGSTTAEGESTKEGSSMDPHGQPQGAAAPGGTTGEGGIAAPGT